ncbi:MAG: NAD-binding protein [Bacillota bacterium]
MQIVIFGCSQLGAVLAARLSELGESVVVVDPREESFTRLPVDFAGFGLAADLTEAATWRRARLEQADFVYVLTDQFPVNLMLSIVAQQYFGVLHVAALVKENDQVDLLKRLNIEAIQSDLIIADAITQNRPAGGGRSS